MCYTRCCSNDRSTSATMTTRNTVLSLEWDPVDAMFEEIEDTDADSSLDSTISLTNVLEIRQHLEDLSRRHWCFQTKGYEFDGKLVCPDCVEDQLIMDELDENTIYYLRGFEQHLRTNACLNFIYLCHYCKRPIGDICPIEECGECSIYVGESSPTSDGDSAGDEDSSSTFYRPEVLVIEQIYRNFALWEISALFHAAAAAAAYHDYDQASVDSLQTPSDRTSSNVDVVVKNNI